MLRTVWQHPSNRASRLGALARWAGWQTWKAVTKRPVTVRFWRDLRVRVYPDWPYSWTALYVRLAEYDDMMFALRYLRPGDAVVDVGANIGYYSLLAASVNGGAPVIAFEPHPTAASRLVENVALNHFPNVFLVEAAAGDVNGTAELTTDRFDQNRIATKADVGLTERVRLVTLDSELTRQGVLNSQVALVKVDTEGFEARVIRGSSELLDTVPGPVWIIELAGFGNDYGESDLEVLKTFRERGYAALQFDARDGSLHSWTGGTPRRLNVIFAKDPEDVTRRIGQPTMDRAGATKSPL